MWLKLLLSFFVVVVAQAGSINKPSSNIKLAEDEDPELRMSSPEMINYFGYPVETHTVITPDGYIIQIFRIPYGLKPSTGPKTPLMLQHGLLCSSDDWVLNFPYQSLGFAAADAGYDVWITNIRGNKYGRNSTYLSPEDDDFWHFSWDQNGEYDVPTVIDYILAQTGYQQLYYVGHSMGTTMAFAMLSTKTEYNAKIKTFIAMGPVATLNHVNSPIKYIAPFAKEINYLFQLFGSGEFLPSSEATAWLAEGCVSTIPELCQNILFILCGYDLEELNTTRMDVYVTHTPAGTSTWTVIHYGQEINAGRFRHCDWGIDENRDRYGQSTPPDYDVTQVTVPTALFWGQNDLLADPQDVDILSYQLPNLIGSFQIGNENWAHMDFLWGIDTGTIVNPQAFELLPRF